MLFVPVSHRRYISRHTKRNTTHLSSRSRHTRDRASTSSRRFTRGPWRSRGVASRSPCAGGRRTGRGGTQNHSPHNENGYGARRPQLKSHHQTHRHVKPQTNTTHSNKHHLGVSSTVRDARPTSEHTPSQRQHWLRGGSTNYGTCAKTKIDLSAARDMLAVHAHAPNLASLNRKDRSPSPPPPPPALVPGPWPPPPGPPRRRRRRRRRHRRRRRRLPPPSPSLCTP